MADLRGILKIIAKLDEESVYQAITQLNKMLAKHKGEIKIEAKAADLSKLQSAINGINAKGVKETSAEFSRLNQLITEANRKEIQMTGLTDGRAKNRIQEMGTQVSTLRDQIDGMTGSMSLNETQITKLADKEARYNRDLQIAEQMHIDRSNTMAQRMEIADKMTNQYSRSIEQLGKRLVQLLIIRQVFQAFKQAINDLKALEQGLVNLSKVADVTRQDFARLATQTLKTASEFGRSAADMANAMTNFARAGYDNYEAMARLALIGQAAGYMSEELTSQYLIASDKALGLGGNIEKLNALLDSQNQVSNRNAISMEFLAAATKNYANVAMQTNESAASMTAMLTAVGTATQKTGDEVSRALRTISLRLTQVKNAFKGLEIEEVEGEILNAGEMSSAAKNLEEIGIKIIEVGKDGKENFKALSEVVLELRQAMDEGRVSATQLNKIVNALAGVRQAEMMLSLINNTKLYTKALNDFENASGSAMRESEKQAESWEGRVNKLNNAWALFINKSLDASEVSRGFLGILTSLLNSFENIWKVLLALGPAFLSLALPKIVGMFGALTTAVRATTMSVAGLQAALGIFSILATAVTLIIGKISQHQKELTQNALTSAESVKSNAQALGTLKDEIADLKSKMADENTSTEDSIAARNRLKDIQAQLIKTYGHEADQVNLLRLSVDDLNTSFDNLSRQDAEKWLRDNTAAIVAAEKELAKTGNFSSSLWFAGSVDKEIQDFAAKIAKELQGVYTWNPITGMMELVFPDSEREEALQKMQTFYDELYSYADQYGLDVNKIAGKLRTGIDKINTEAFQSAKKVMDERALNELVAHYSNAFSEILNLQEEFSAAGEETQAEILETLVSKMVELRDGAAAEGKAYIANYIDGMMAGLDQQRLQNILDSLGILKGSSKTTVEEISKTTDAITKLREETEALEAGKKGEGLSQLMADYPKLISYMGDEKTLNEEIQKLIDDRKKQLHQLNMYQIALEASTNSETVRAAQAANAKKYENDKVLWNNIKNGMGQLVTELAKAYGADEANWTTLAKAKLDIETSLIKSLSSMWGDYFSIVAGNIRLNPGSASDVLGNPSDPGYLARDKKLENDILKKQAELNKVYAQFDAAAAAFNSFSPSGSIGGGGGGKSSGGGGGKDSWLEEYEDYISALKHLRTMELISLDDYISQYGKLTDKYLAGQSKYAKQLRSANEELYSLKKQQLTYHRGIQEHEIFLLQQKINPTGNDQYRISAIYENLRDQTAGFAKQLRDMGVTDRTTLDALSKEWWDYENKRLAATEQMWDTFLQNRKNQYQALLLGGADKKALIDFTRGTMNAIFEEIALLDGKMDTHSTERRLKLQQELASIKSDVSDMLNVIVSESAKSLGDVEGYYNSLKKAAEEYAQSGFISLDSFRSILEMGPEYLKYLTDENGNLSLNKTALENLTKARLEDLAVQTSLAYLQKIRIAIQDNDTQALNQLIHAQNEATDSTWGLVNAHLGLLANILSPEDFRDVEANIRHIQDLANAAAGSIYNQTGALRDQEDALGDILRLVMELEKFNVNTEISNLSEQLQNMKEIIELRKTELRLMKEKENFEKKVKNQQKALIAAMNELAKLERDNSGNPEILARRRELTDKIAELQENLSETIADEHIKSQERAYDEELKMYEDKIKEQQQLLKDSISSEQKVYELAIAAIENRWDSLYSELISWNGEYGSRLNSEITDQWELALKAVERYGSAVSALNQSGANAEMPTAIAKSGTGDKSYSGSDTIAAQKEIARGYAAEMQSNSFAYNQTSDKSKQEALAKRNEYLASQLAQIIGRPVVKDSYSGTWHMDSINGQLLYDFMKSYHTGGIVGKDSGGKRNLIRHDNEIMAKLLLGEVVLTPRQIDSFFQKTMPQMTQEYISNNVNNGGINTINVELNVTGVSGSDIVNRIKEQLPEIAAYTIKKVNDETRKQIGGNSRRGFTQRI